MSTLTRPSPADASDDGSVLQYVREVISDHPPTESARGAIQASAFWAAVALPFVHLPLALSGFSSMTEASVFLGLLALNVVALALGHGHRQP